MNTKVFNFYRTIINGGAVVWAVWCEEFVGSVMVSGWRIYGSICNNIIFHTYVGSVLLYYEWVVFILQRCLQIIIFVDLSCNLYTFRYQRGMQILSDYQRAFFQFSLTLGRFCRMCQLQNFRIRRIALLQQAAQFLKTHVAHVSMTATRTNC
jgi:hypothetical protein